MANEMPHRPSSAKQREPMPVSERAKIFMPFDPLAGFTAALRAKELEVEAAKSAGFEPVEDEGAIAPSGGTELP